MKNICFFSGDITRSGGTERVTIQIASELALRKEQYQISILSLMETAPIPFYDIPNDVTKHVILSKPITPINRAIYRFCSILWKLVAFIKEKRIDIIIDVDGILDIFSLPAKILTRVKVVTWEHFNYYTDLGNKFRTYIKRLSARFSDYIIVLTKEDQGYYQKNLKLHCPIEFIYNPIEMDKEIQYQATSKMIFSAGRLTAQKGFDLLIEVANIVFEKHKDWVWVIAGDGEDKEALELKINEYNLSKQIQFVGNIKNIEEYYRNAAIFVLTSRFEGFGLVITEAKRHHLPVVSFACKAGPKELIIDQQNGFLISCFDIIEMASKINLLIEQQELRVHFSEHAYDDTDKLSYNTIFQKWVQVLETL